jgi:hypothetical protein
MSYCGLTALYGSFLDPPVLGSRCDETGTTEDFFARSLKRARRLDRGEKLAAEIRLTFEDPADLLRVLTAQRVRVIHAVRIALKKGPYRREA